MHNKIDDIMCWFNFNKVAIVMQALNWKWAGAADGIPVVGELREVALRLLRQAAAHQGDIEMGTGGFTVKKEQGDLSLSFVVEEWECYEDE